MLKKHEGNRVKAFVKGLNTRPFWQYFWNSNQIRWYRVLDARYGYQCKQ